MVNEKKWLSIDDQIERLESRGMIINGQDYQFVSSVLMQYGYYEIINGYRDPFLANGNHEQFMDNVSFYDIYYLFIFDQFLRDATLSAIELFELSLRQAIARVFAKNHTESQEEYLNYNNYRSSRSNSNKISWLIKKLASIVYVDQDEPYLHYRTQYGNVPPWIAVKGLDFGDLKSWYSLLLPDDKHEIASDLLDSELVNNIGMNEATLLLSSFINLAHKLRNRAAHGGRIYNYFPTGGYNSKTKSERALIPYRHATHIGMRINEGLYRSGYGQTGVWVFLKLTSLLKEKSIFASYSDNFENLLVVYLQENPDTDEKIKEEMRIPDNDIQFRRALNNAVLGSRPQYAYYDLTVSVRNLSASFVKKHYSLYSDDLVAF